MKKIGKKFQFKSIRDKMIAAFSVIILFIIGIVVVAVGSSYSASKQSDAVIQDRLPAIIRFEELTSNFIIRNKVAYEYIVTKNDARGREFIELTEESHQIEQEQLNDNQNKELKQIIENHM